MKTYMMSCSPQEVNDIMSGRKKILPRKTAPKETPFKVVMYETKALTDTPWMDEDGHLDFHGRGQVVGEFICDKVNKYSYATDCYDETKKMYYITCGEFEKTCLTDKEFNDYGNGKDLFGINITAVKAYDRPKELGEFRKPCGNCIGKCAGEHYDRCPWQTVTRPPQSWMYVEEEV